MKHYDVIVIGGGHAGAEAAAAAARSGALTALISMKKSTIGVMSCNPAIGGLGKGHLVREIDAMDGIMGRAADAAGIQFRLLNRRKGPAVQGPRAQADRQLYRAAIQESLGAQPGLTIVEGEVTRLQIEGDRVTGVVLAEGEMLSARAVVLTAGTFLNGLMHIGDKRSVGGRVGDNASISLAGQLAELSLGRGRLKTGTPPRLDGRTIDWSKLELQPGDADPVMFSFLNKMPAVRQIACGITHTNERTHDIVRENLNKSAMYGGFIEGVGPRYCPSIEDKIVRFADKTSHQIFLEPEGLQDDTIYPNGISTSLPAEVQEAYVRSIAGLENVRITQPGYAIEYDFFDPRGLTSALAVREVSGLYFAGQINGTTGYEEAAAQGLVAGLNAAREARNLAPVHFGRSDSYIGVMVDDLISRGVSEPYRMFTSRAEFRLSLRADNADQRLTAKGIEAGCVTTARAAAFQTKMAALDSARQILESVSFRAAELATAGLQPSRSGAARTALQLLSMNDVGRDQLDSLSDVFAKIEPEILTQISINSLYDQYVGRQSSEAAALRSDATQPIPASLDYDALSGLSAELRTKLKRHRPENLHQAKGIEGMTPAGLVLIMAAIRRDTKSAVNE